MGLPHPIQPVSSSLHPAASASTSVTPAGNPDDHLAVLNSQQRLAVLHGMGVELPAVLPVEKRALLVIAGAGSGKTNTLAYRVAQLVHGGADAQRILLL